MFTDDRERAFAISVWTSAHSVGATIGPLLGGLASERWGWGAVILVNVPVVVIILIVGARVIPESKNPDPRRWDLGCFGSYVALLFFLTHWMQQVGGDSALRAGLSLMPPRRTASSPPPATPITTAGSSRRCSPPDTARGSS
ncbi:MFS transporter [Streptomyces sp. NPDC088789]|uniref:MFS transporter n=1 Tax=Streptomyces sp. NPDC088789 TaxID=3365899 RepID=UPI0038053BAD